MERFNLIYLHSHDTGRYVQPFGHAISTPNIQKLAEQGVLFRQAFCTNPTCSPSRASLLTGQWPHNNGMLGLAHRGFRLNDNSHHIAHTLRGAGYETAVVGPHHVTQRIDGYEEVGSLGFERAIEPGQAGARGSAARSPMNAQAAAAGAGPLLKSQKLGAEGIANAAIQFIKEKHDRPFFVSVGFSETHRRFPEMPDAGDDPRYTLPPPGLPDTPVVRRDMATFKTAARRLDELMGRVVAAVDEAGLAENTLIICTTDHGIAFPFMKCNLTDQGLGVMLIMRGPGGFAGGKVIDAMASQIDLFPTICDLLKIPPPAWLQGVSLMPLIRGQAEEVRQELFGEVNFHAAPEPMRCVRTTRWKYIRRYEPRQGPVLANCDDSPTKEVLLSYGWKERAPADEALYDLMLDPMEGNNLVARPEMAPVLQEMRTRLKNWQEQTDDPLLNGSIEEPPYAEVRHRE